LLQFTSIPNFARPIQLLVTIGSKNLKQNFVLPPFVAIYYVNMVAEKSFKLPHSLLPLRILWQTKRAQEHCGDINFCILEYFSFQEDKALGSCPSMLSLGPVASATEPVDRFP
jgi:hypothetical protein